MDDPKTEQLLQRTIQTFRRLGWAFLVFGGVMLLVCLFKLFDPEGTIRVSGVATRDFGTKLGVVAFVSVFPVIGLLLTLLPKKMVEPGFRHTFRQVGEMTGTKFRKK